MTKRKRSFSSLTRESFPISLRDALISLGFLACGVVLCFFLQFISDTDFHVPLIFVLVVLLISLFTDGYFFGLVASVISVFAVNFAFTYPYFHFNFSMTGYPLTFLCMFVVSVSTCTLMSRVRAGEQMRLEAEKEKMRANLLRAISHDFRTPLTSIIGTLGVLGDPDNGLSEEDKLRLMSDSRSDAEWLINMMENILSITRIGDGSAPHIHTDSQALEELIGEAVSRFRKQYPKLEVKILIPEELILASVDAMLIEQVIINFLINVVLHGEGATWAKLSLSRQDEMAKISVEDNGKGINKQALAHLLDEKSTYIPSEHRQDSHRTMGIGLSVCRTIIRAHGGTLTATNAEEGGAILSFTLPIIKEDENGDPFQDFDN